MNASSDRPSGSLGPAPSVEPWQPFVVLRPFTHGLMRFVQRLPALVASGLFLVIAWFDFGSDYNVPAILWIHSDREAIPLGVKQFVTGVSVSLLFGYIWLVTFVVEAHLHHRKAITSTAPDLPAWANWLVDRLLPRLRPDADEFSRRIRTYFAVTWLPLMALMAAATLQQPARRFPFLLGQLAVYAVVYALAVRSRNRPPQGHQLAIRLLASWLFLGLFVVYVIFCLLLYLNPSWLFIDLNNGLPPAVSLCFVFAVLTGLLNAIWYYARGWAPVIFMLLGVWLVYCNSLPYKLRFLNLDYQEPLVLDDAEEPQAPPAGALELAAPTIADADLAAERDRLIRACARLHARIFPAAAAQEPFASMNYESLFARYRKLQLIFVFMGLHQQLYPENAPARKPADLDQHNYAILFRQYRELLDSTKSLEEQQYLNSWRQRLTSETAPRPRLVVVAVTGGANRSALWTIVALTELENRLRGPGSAEGESRFPQHIRLIAGASGGMVGASHYVATLDERGRHLAFKQDSPDGPWTVDLGPDRQPIKVSLVSKFDPVSQVDYLSPVINRWVFRDLPMFAWPWPYGEDRGRALEGCFEGTTHEMEQSFAALRPGELAGWRPSLVFSPMLVEDGRRLFISNLPLGPLATSAGAMLLDQANVSSARRIKQYEKDDTLGIDRYSRSAVELFRLFPEASARFKLSTAARMNATFPYISPAVNLPTEPTRRTVDAGYYDNYGVDVASRWIFEHRQWLRDHTSGVVLIQLRDVRSNTRRRQLIDPDVPPSSRFGRAISRSFEWLTGPVDAAATAYVAVSSFRNDEQLEILNEWFNKSNERQGDAKPFFTTAIFERPGNTGMNWYLEENEMEAIRKGMSAEPNKTVLLALEHWWNGGASQRLP